MPLEDPKRPIGIEARVNRRLKLLGWLLKIKVYQATKVKFGEEKQLRPGSHSQ